GGDDSGVGERPDVPSDDPRARRGHELPLEIARCGSGLRPRSVFLVYYPASGRRSAFLDHAQPLGRAKLALANLRFARGLPRRPALHRWKARVNPTSSAALRWSRKALRRPLATSFFNLTFSAADCYHRAL